MTESQASPASAATVSDLRTLTIVCYVLYFVALFSGITAVIGVIIAYVKKGDARGTRWESHLDNLISVFWVALIGFIVGVLTIWMLGLGFLILVALFVWYLYRTIKGILAAVDSKPYV
ncbi:MAG: DUF4870 family protein [Alphaproteobacteria bacterium]